MRVTALDLSLTATGFAIGGIRNPKEAMGVLKPNGMQGFERVDWVRGKVLELVHGSDLVVVEGYAFAAHQSYARAIAELGGVIRMTLYDLGFRWVEVAPKSLKKYAAGTGNAKKELVLVEAVKRLEYSGSDNNEADALWLLEMAMDHYGVVKSLVPKANRQALEKIDWPSIAPNHPQRNEAP